MLCRRSISYCRGAVLIPPPHVHKSHSPVHVVCLAKRSPINLELPTFLDWAISRGSSQDFEVVTGTLNYLNQRGMEWRREMITRGQSRVREFLRQILCLWARVPCYQFQKHLIKSGDGGPYVCYCTPRPSVIMLGIAAC
jgi:hypothetical protein